MRGRTSLYFQKQSLDRSMQTAVCILKPFIEIMVNLEVRIGILICGDLGRFANCNSMKLKIRTDGQNNFSFIDVNQSDHSSQINSHIDKQCTFRIVVHTRLLGLSMMECLIIFL